MTCGNNWTVKFREVNRGDDFEIRPVQMSLKLSRDQYDFCRAKFPSQVGEYMKEETRNESGRLHGYKPVDICYNGESVKRLIFRSDWAEFGNSFTHIKFKDMHYALNTGTVDIQRTHVTLEEIYEEVIEQANNAYIQTDDLKFTKPDDEVRVLVGRGRGNEDEAEAEKEFREERENSEDRELATRKIVESKYAVDFENIVPAKAIQRLNKKYRIKSWANKEGELIVGIPEANQVRHIAAPNDERVWRYKNPNISHGREPIKRCLVEGSWVDEPGWGGFDELSAEIGSWFSGGNDNQGGADVRAYGIAKRTDIDYGTEFIVKSSNGKRDSLPGVAEAALREQMRQSDAGTVEIDPVLSGSEQSKIINLQPGDMLHLVPDDSLFDNPTASSGGLGDEPDKERVCDGYVHNDVYLVSEVEHNVTDDGHWQVFADVGLYTQDIDIATEMAYFDPEENEFLTKEDSEINDDGRLKFGIFEGI